LTLRRTVAGTPGLSLLVLFGSRARGSDRPSSDWDFGYAASPGFDPDHLLGVLVDTLNSDRIDLVDLRRAGAPLRYRAARDGRVVAEAENGEFARFWLDAVSFWCDVQPLLRRGYDAVLAELGRDAARSRLPRERTIVVERHLARVAARLPASEEAFQPATDASDAVVLHLWQATQVVIDLATSACLHFNLGAPASYADAFRRLSDANVIGADLASRLGRAAGFRNVIAHAYDQLDMVRVHRAAREGPADLRAFLATLRDRLSPAAS
jgi:uncharacterized protein YutE (UPF0331/DUF86 family)/predicted nucleotidyltransferase